MKKVLQYLMHKECDLSILSTAIMAMHLTLRLGIYLTAHPIEKCIGGHG